MEEGADSEKIALDKIGQEQIHGLLFVEKLSWQQIIYDLIKSEQLDPWDIDISLLSNRFLERVMKLEEANFFISSQVLLAASLLLRLKSEILLNQYIPSLDAVLFGRKAEEKRYIQERIELDEEVPGLVLRTPLPRFRKVTLEELMSALGQAIKTENRRIRKVVVARQQELETALSLPKHRINLKDKIKEVHLKLKKMFSSREEKIAFSELAGKDEKDRVATFIPLLHLDNQHKIWLEQEGHFKEIWILLKHIYEKQNFQSLEEMRKEAEIAIESLVKEESELRKKNKKIKSHESESEEDAVEEFVEGMTGFANPPKEVREIENTGDDEPLEN
ncbi:MAG TPA: segregation/condensation protein A [Candidatus Nanoarchaeia archaeon]|nr:segregation/condensation protein A [Candidatus Nanoarchaeia archaeon]